MPPPPNFPKFSSERWKIECQSPRAAEIIAFQTPFKKKRGQEGWLRNPKMVMKPKFTHSLVGYMRWLWLKEKPKGGGIRFLSLGEKLVWLVKISCLKLQEAYLLNTICFSRARRRSPWQRPQYFFPPRRKDETVESYLPSHTEKMRPTL